MNYYYDPQISDTVLLAGSITKRYRISVRNQVPYITYNRKTRVLYTNHIGGAFIRLNGSRVYFT